MSVAVKNTGNTEPEIDGELFRLHATFPEGDVTVVVIAPSDLVALKALHNFGRDETILALAGEMMAEYEDEEDWDE